MGYRKKERRKGGIKEKKDERKEAKKEK